MLVLRVTMRWLVGREEGYAWVCWRSGYRGAEALYRPGSIYWDEGAESVQSCSRLLHLAEHSQDQQADVAFWNSIKYFFFFLIHFFCLSIIHCFPIMFK